MQIAQEGDAVQQLFEGLRSSKFVESLKVTPQDLQWALNCVYSRSFAVPKPIGKLFHVSSQHVCMCKTGEDVF